MKVEITTGISTPQRIELEVRAAEKRSPNVAALEENWHVSLEGENWENGVLKNLRNLIRENHLAYRRLPHKQLLADLCRREKSWRRCQVSAKGHMRKPTYR